MRINTLIGGIYITALNPATRSITIVNSTGAKRQTGQVLTVVVVDLPKGVKSQRNVAAFVKLDKPRTYHSGL
jgi:hypothetical protein